MSRHLLALSLAVLVPLLSACGSDSEGGGTTGDNGDEGLSTTASPLCVDLINKHRASISLPPYERWEEAEMCASEQARSDSIAEAPHDSFGKCGEFAQNECPDHPGEPEAMIEGCLQAMWNEGPGEDFATHGHYINMASTDYTMVACGFFKTYEGKVWAIQDFK